jgi:60 kDa SS-A/Ro ribonucleoprotein
MAKTPYHDISTRETPQSEAIAGTVPNSAGGHAYPVDDWTRLQRFLILGSAGGSYYASEAKLTKDNAKVVEKCLRKDYVATIDTIVNVSIAGRNAKQEPVMFALAMAAGCDIPEARAKALRVLPEVCRTGTHLFLFISYIEQFRGWGRGLRDAVANWYLTKSPDELEFQVAKYRQRGGWSHKDVLYLSKPQFFHPDKVTPATDAILKWAAGKEQNDFNLLSDFLKTVDATQKGSLPAMELADIISENRLPWECVSTEALAHPETWHALLPHMPIGALVRNLGRMTANGTLKPMTGATAHVISRLTNGEAVRKSRIHPLSVLLASATYAEGKGVRGKLSWTPIAQINDALDEAFHLAFANVEPANKRTLLALDVSGSMGWPHIAGTFITPRTAAAAMALVTARTEPRYQVIAFASAQGMRSYRRQGIDPDDGLMPVDITKRSTLKSTLRATDSLPFGGTDCALPMLYAIKHQIEIDTFVVYTDSETWAGHIHPSQALGEYRRQTGIQARLVVVGMVANEFSIADPKDAGMLDVVGFDSAAPALISDFSAGRI